LSANHEPVSNRNIRAVGAIGMNYGLILARRRTPETQPIAATRLTNITTVKE